MYASPELVVIGRADMLVLGGRPGKDDHLNSSTDPAEGLPLGLDD